MNEEGGSYQRSLDPSPRFGHNESLPPDLPLPECRKKTTRTPELQGSSIYHS